MLGPAEREGYVRMMSTRADLKKIEIKTKHIDLDRDNQIAFASKHSRWGNRTCNCNNPDKCRMHCAAVLWTFGDIALNGIFHRTKTSNNPLVNLDVVDPRLSFIHFMVWDSYSRRPVIVESCQSASATKDLVSKALATRITELPPVLSAFCSHRGEVTVSKLEKQLRDMSDKLKIKQHQVFFIFYLLFHLLLCLYYYCTTVYYNFDHRYNFSSLNYNKHVTRLLISEFTHILMKKTRSVGSLIDLINGLCFW